MKKPNYIDIVNILLILYAVAGLGFFSLVHHNTGQFNGTSFAIYGLSYYMFHLAAEFRSLVPLTAGSVALLVSSLSFITEVQDPPITFTYVLFSVLLSSKGLIKNEQIHSRQTR